jgi:hypothetical protein
VQAALPAPYAVGQPFKAADQLSSWSLDFGHFYLKMFLIFLAVCCFIYIDEAEGSGSETPEDPRHLTRA